MTVDPPLSPFGAWQAALAELTSDEATARNWRQRRYHFAHRLGHALVGNVGTTKAVSGPVLYGVWLQWGLLYIGQTLDAQRRLRDLPVGESHHLATTFPPEIWHRVVVIEWPKLPEAAPLTAQLPLAEIGLALEHGLQLRLHPLANSERRTAEGGWRPVDRTGSKSRGARATKQVRALFDAVCSAWDQAANQSPETAASSPTCRVIFPDRLLDMQPGP
jgi:hypothetical protein